LRFFFHPFLNSPPPPPSPLAPPPRGNTLFTLSLPFHRLKVFFCPPSTADFFCIPSIRFRTSFSAPEFPSIEEPLHDTVNLISPPRSFSEANCLDLRGGFFHPLFARVLFFIPPFPFLEVFLSRAFYNDERSLQMFFPGPPCQVWDSGPTPILAFTAVPICCFLGTGFSLRLQIF